MSNPYAGRRTLVLGAAGFIGRWVARELTAAGADLHVTVLGQSTDDAVFERFAVRGVRHVVDLAAADVVEALVADTAPDIVFNLAGYGVDPAERDPVFAGRLNVELVARLVDAVALLQDGDWRGQRLVHVGTAAEYGSFGGDLDESGPTEPIGLYGQTKLAGTQALEAGAVGRRVRAVVARLFTVYGPGERDGRLVPSLLAAAAGDGTIPLTEGAQRRDFTYVEDAVEALLRVGTSDASPGAVFNAATGELTSVHDFVMQAAEVLGIPEERLGFGEVPTRPDEMAHDPVTTRRIEDLLGWRPSTSIADGIARTRDFQGA